MVDALEQWLPVYGPWLLFVMAVLETSFVTGLVVPSGLATSVGTVLAGQGELALESVVLAALAGGWAGDAVGFWIGRVADTRALDGTLRLSAVTARRHERLGRFFGRHPVYSVTVARWVSFVRTLMPMAAGMSRLPFRAYLAYEAPGVVGWVALYVAIGFLAGESWVVATRLVGVGGAVTFAGVGAVLWLTLRRRGAARLDRAVEDATDARNRYDILAPDDEDAC